MTKTTSGVWNTITRFGVEITRFETNHQVFTRLWKNHQVTRFLEKKTLVFFNHQVSGKITRFSPGFGKNHQVFTVFTRFWKITRLSEKITRFSPGFEKSLGFRKNHQVLGKITRFSPGFEKSPGFHQVLKNHQVSLGFRQVLKNHQVLGKITRFSPGFEKSPGFGKNHQVFTRFWKITRF